MYYDVALGKWQYLSPRRVFWAVTLHSAAVCDWPLGLSVWEDVLLADSISTHRADNSSHTMPQECIDIDGALDKS